MASIQQGKIDGNIKSILDILKTDAIISNGSLGLLALLDQWMMSPRQIAKKITSLNSTISLSDKDLNLMFYGQDLAAIDPNYKAYETETEDQVRYDTNYEPMDIRDMMRQIINDLKTEVRMAIRSLEGMMSTLKATALSTTKQFIATLAAAVTKLAPGPTLDPLGLQALGLGLHAAVNSLRGLVISILSVMPILTSVPDIHGPSSQITTPQVKTPSINGAPAVKIPIKTSTVVIPKLTLLLNDKNLDTILAPINVLLDILKVVADIIVAMDIALLVIDTTAAILPDPDISVAASLL